MAGETIQVQGLEQLRAKFAEIPRQLRARLLRNWLAAGARLVRDEARRKTPVLSRPAPYRKSGTVRDAISVRTSKVSRKDGNVGVFVNVKPLPGAKYKSVKTRGFFGGTKRTFKMVRASMRGSKNPSDPFYWRWLEFGWNPGGADRSAAGKRARRDLNKRGAPKKVAGFGFLKAATAKLPDALRVFEAASAKWFKKINADGKVTP